MLKWIAAVLLVMLSLSLTGCASAASGLKSYVDSTDGYQFCILMAGQSVKWSRCGVSRFD